MKPVDRHHFLEAGLIGFMKPNVPEQFASWGWLTWLHDAKRSGAKSKSAIFFDILLIARNEPVELQKIYDYVEKEDILSSL